MIRFVSVAALALLLTGCTRYEPHGTLLDPPMNAPEFVLTSADGAVAKSDFQGQLVVLSFGFTRCPDVCPDTVSRLARAVRQLDPEQAQQVQVVVVSVDPWRDSPERIHTYAQAFHPTFVGVSGTPEEIAAVAAGYGIFFERAELDSGDYTVDHTAATTVLNRRGETVLIWPYGTDADAIADDLRFLLRRA
jgi:protein SCO1